MTDDADDDDDGKDGDAIATGLRSTITRSTPSLSSNIWLTISEYLLRSSAVVAMLLFVCQKMENEKFGHDSFVCLFKFTSIIFVIRLTCIFIQFEWIDC